MLNQETTGFGKIVNRAIALMEEDIHRKISTGCRMGNTCTLTTEWVITLIHQVPIKYGAP